MNLYTYKIHLHKEEEGGFTVFVPALSGCIIPMVKMLIMLLLWPRRQ